MALPIAAWRGRAHIGSAARPLPRRRGENGPAESGVAEKGAQQQRRLTAAQGGGENVAPQKVAW